MVEGDLACAANLGRRAHDWPYWREMIRIYVNGPDLKPENSHRRDAEAAEKRREDWKSFHGRGARSRRGERDNTRKEQREKKEKTNRGNEAG